MSRNNASSSAISNLPETEVFQNTGGGDPIHCGPEEQREYSREHSLSDECEGNCEAKLNQISSRRSQINIL